MQCKHLWLALACASTLAVGLTQLPPAAVHATTTTTTSSEVTQKTLYQLPESSHVHEYRPMGFYQDRQALGIVLSKGATIKIRQSNSSYPSKLTVQLLGSSSKTAITKTVGSSWVSITATENMVVFVKTPHTNSVNPKVQYSVTSGTATTLPQYTSGTDQSSWLSSWKSSKAAYALICANNITIMVPYSDIDRVAKTNLTTLIKEYDNGVFDLYNSLTGYTSNTSLTDHHMGKYFAMADKTGSGSGYYSTNMIATNSSSAATWLSISWLVLHEIGHGYEVPSKYITITDSFNNIYGTIWQLQHLSNFKANAWVFNGNATNATNYTMNSLLAGKTWNQLDYHPRLQLWMNLAYNLKGTAAFQAFNLYHKRAAYSGLSVVDIASDWAQVYTHHYHLNVASYWQTLGVSVNQTQAINAYNQPAVAMLYQVVPASILNNSTKFAALLTKLGLASNPLATKVTAVTNATLAQANLTSNIKLHLSASDYAKLKGTHLFIRNGSETVRTVKITSQTLTLDDMPNGVYELGNGKLGKIVGTYLYVKDSGTINLNLTK